MSVTNKACIEAVLGSSGSGKSAYIKQKLRKEKPSRIIIFDPMGEYTEFAEQVTTLSDLVKKSKLKHFKIAFKPNFYSVREQFSFVCKVAYELGCWLVVDELAIVTKPNKAPPAWADCSMRGRHRGMTVIGASQRPASIDKDFFGNATLVRCGRLNYEDDIKTMANVLRVKKDVISDLQPLDFIQREMATGKTISGTIKF